MSKISTCSRCGGTKIEPAFEGDGVYGEGSCRCAERHTALVSANRDRDEQDSMERWHRSTQCTAVNAQTGRQCSKERGHFGRHA